VWGRAGGGAAGGGWGVWSRDSVGMCGLVVVKLWWREGGGRQTGWLTLAEELYKRRAFGGVQDGCWSHLRGRTADTVGR
jgi:hypothetical protein